MSAAGIGAPVVQYSLTITTQMMQGSYSLSAALIEKTAAACILGDGLDLHYPVSTCYEHSPDLHLRL